MTRFDPSRDPLLGEVLRRMDPKPAGPRQLDQLTARIEDEAAPLLSRRRDALGWSEYVAHWAGTLVPLGVMTALAAGLCLAWLAHQQRSSVDRAVERAALLGVATGGAASGDLIELATRDTPPPSPSRPRR